MSMNLDKLNWYPGHMKKTRQTILENLKMVDVVLEILDARIPVSSKNPIIDQLLEHKERLVLLNKQDLASHDETLNWIEHLKKQGINSIAINAESGEGINKLLRYLEALEKERNENRAVPKRLRIMVVGVPNVGKSSLINRLTGKKSTQTGNRPGVTKGKQWASMINGMQLLDTPGILWPKFEDPKTGIYLAYCGSIKDEIMDREELALALIDWLLKNEPKALEKRYCINLNELQQNMKLEEDPYLYMMDDEKKRALMVLDEICKKRGFLLGKGRMDYERGSRTVVDEFRSGRLGCFTLEEAKYD